jgi:hypothetical protein
MSTVRKEKSGESKGYQAHGMSWSLVLASANSVMAWSNYSVRSIRITAIPLILVFSATD